MNCYANRTNLLSEHAQFKLSLDQARALVDQVQRVVADRWLAVLRQHGASEAACDRLAPFFNYRASSSIPGTCSPPEAEAK